VKNKLRHSGAFLEFRIFKKNSHLKMQEDDPFEHTHSGTLRKMFDKDREHQWVIDLYEKHTGKPLAPKKQDSTRTVIRSWPRDPKGKIIKELPVGKETPSSTHLWGQVSTICFFAEI
jgi:hypothetical protein